MYEYSVVCRADPNVDELRIDAVVTAFNLYGQSTTSVVVSKTAQESSVADLIDLTNMRFKKQPYVDGMLDKAIDEGDFADFEFDGSCEGD